MGSSEILAQYNATKAQLEALNYDDIYNNEKERNSANKQADIDAFSAVIDSQINDVNTVYNKNVNDTTIAYEDSYQRNAVQKLINEKLIAEKNANLGLTNSGLNQTQQTAVQLSYSNNKGNLDVAKQSVLDGLALSLTQSITQLQNEKTNGIRNIENEWDKYSATQAEKIYNTQYTGYVDQLNSLSEQYNAAVEQERKALEEALRRQNESTDETANDEKLLWYYTGTYDENGNPKFRNSEGKIQVFGSGVNPYTGDNNQISLIKDDNGTITNGTDTQKAVGYYGVFSNGYQPKGVVVNGEKYGSIKAYDEIPAGNGITGKKQNVWYTADTNKYWIWYGEGNTYVEVALVGRSWVVI